MIRIIDHKKIFLTNDEFQMYKKLCRSYDRPNFKGEDLFQDHFDTNSEGIITFVKPPHRKYSSLEIYCFLVSIMVNQHIRIIHEQTNVFVKEANEEYKKLINEIKEQKSEIEALKLSVEKGKGDNS